MINIHGHIHGARKYVEPKPKNHVDVYAIGGKDLRISTLPEILDAKEEVSYNLTIWMDESVTADTPTMNKEFIGKITVTSNLTQIAHSNFSEMVMNKNAARLLHVFVILNV